MWEWRVFFEGAASGANPGARGPPDIWALLDSRPWSMRPEKRTDWYVACSTLSGVKLRGGNTLEVKLRSERHESGAERWEKVNSIRRLGKYNTSTATCKTSLVN